MPRGSVKQKKEKDPKRVRAGKRSKTKGNANEREIAKLFKEWWGHGEWARTPSSGGWATKQVREGFRTCGDILTTAEDFPFCVEAKHQKRWDLVQLLTAPKSLLYKFWAQAVEETPSGLLPLLVVHKNNRERLVITRESVFCDTVIQHVHLRLCRSQTEETLVILKLSDLFLMHPALFARSCTDDEEATEDTHKAVTHVSSM